MKAFKLCENAQLKNLSTAECNNNSTSNGKSANSYVKSAMDNIKNGDVLSDKSKVFKQRMSSSTTSTVATDANTGERIASSKAAAAASTKKSCNIENFLSSNVPNGAAATVETARNGLLAAAAAAQQYTPFNLFTPYLKDMFFAAQLLRGKPKRVYFNVFNKGSKISVTQQGLLHHAKPKLAKQMLNLFDLIV